MYVAKETGWPYSQTTAKKYLTVATKNAVFIICQHFQINLLLRVSSSSSLCERKLKLEAKLL